MRNETVANQTTLSTSIGGPRARHEVITGIDLARELTGNRNSSQTANQPPVALVGPNPNDQPFGAMPPNSGNPSSTGLNQLGVYAFDTMHVGERWQVTGGVRWDDVGVDYEQSIAATGEVTSITADDSMWSWRAGAVYTPRPNGSVYVGLGTSFNPAVDAAAGGAGFSTSPTAANNPNLAPERTNNIEAGTKWDLAGERLSINTAVFRTEKTNARTRNATSDPFVLAGRQRVTGIEAGVSGRITTRWTALANYAFMDSTIAASANAAEEGQNFTLTPEHSFNAWTTYQLPRQILIGGGLQYMDNVFRNTLNTQRVPSYWLASALASYAVNEMLTLRINGQNLADVQYVDRVGGGHYIPGPRRQVTLTADVTF
jgi:catecholate siderophore receptor